MLKSGRAYPFPFLFIGVKPDDLRPGEYLAAGLGDVQDVIGIGGFAFVVAQSPDTNTLVQQPGVDGQGGVFNCRRKAHRVLGFI